MLLLGNTHLEKTDQKLCNLKMLIVEKKYLQCFTLNVNLKLKFLKFCCFSSVRSMFSPFIRVKL
jgi:hypothetical protein